MFIGSLFAFCEFMSVRAHRRWYWALFGVALLLAVCGWLWVLQRLVKNEAEVAEAKIRQAEERFLQEVRDGFLQEVEEQLQQVEGDEGFLPRMAREGVMNGVWLENTLLFDSPGYPDQFIGEWRKKIQKGEVSGDELVSALDDGILQWGWIEEGRDAVAGMVLSFLRKGEASEVLVARLRSRVWDYDGLLLSSGFRLLLIRELQRHDSDPALERLAEAELIRIAEGDLEKLEGYGAYEIFETNVSGKKVLVFWSKEQLEKLLLRSGGEEVELLKEQVEGRAGVSVDGFSQWPVLAMKEDGGVASGAVLKSGAALVWVGSLTGVVVLVLTLVAAVLASRASRLARMRTDLAASVAHELRTPLAGQRLLLESLLDRDDQTEEEQREYIAMAFRENKRLSRLAEEFLTFSRLERGVLVLEQESVDAVGVVRNAVESLNEKWSGSKSELEVDVSNGLPRIMGDGQAVVTVLRNLLENAWKYSESPKKIEVGAREMDGGVRFAVTDNGIGLAEKERERIFRQFYRVDQALARSQDGLGLGLSIVKQLVEAMQGRVEVKSEKGKGSEFSVWLPAVK